MGVQTVVDEVPLTRIYEEQEYPAGVWTLYRDQSWVQNVVVKETFETDKPDTSRTKPTGFLPGYMTSIGPYERYTLTHQLERKHSPMEILPGPSPKKRRESWDWISRLPTIQHVQDPLPAANKHLNRVRGNSDDYAQSIAEVHKAADGFLDIAQKTRDIWRAVKGKHSRRKKLTPCDVSSAHLATEYGIKPVVSDLDRSITNLSRSVENKKVKIVTTRQTRETTSANGEVWNCYHSERYVTWVSIPGPAGLRANLGSPAEWAWELIPYSFVVDWMFNVGDTIAAYGAGRGLNHIATALITHKRSRLASMEPTADFSVQSRARGSYDYFRRIILPDLPTPTRVEFDPAGLRALPNAFALLHQVNDQCKGGQRRHPSRW